MNNLREFSICDSCEKPIMHNGEYWVHTTCNPRHPAKPVQMDELYTELADAAYKYFRIKHLIELLEERGR